MRNVFIYRCFASGGARGQESAVSNRLRGHFSGWSRIQPSTCLRPRRSSGHITAPPSLQWPCVPESDGQTGCSQKEAGWLRDREGLYIESCRGGKGRILALKAAFAKRSGGIEMERNTQIDFIFLIFHRNTDHIAAIGSNHYSALMVRVLQEFWYMERLFHLEWFHWDVFWQWVLVWGALCAFAASAKNIFSPEGWNPVQWSVHLPNFTLI